MGLCWLWGKLWTPGEAELHPGPEAPRTEPGTDGPLSLGTSGGAPNPRPTPQQLHQTWPGDFCHECLPRCQACTLAGSREYPRGTQEACLSPTVLGAIHLPGHHPAPHTGGSALQHLLDLEVSRASSSPRRAPPICCVPLRPPGGARGPGFAKPRLPDRGSSQEQARGGLRAAVTPGPLPGAPALAMVDRWPRRPAVAFAVEPRVGLLVGSAPPRPRATMSRPYGAVWMSQLLPRPSRSWASSRTFSGPGQLTYQQCTWPQAIRVASKVGSVLSAPVSRSLVPPSW